MNLRKRHKRISAEVQTSAMNYIMFFMLLFVLIASAITNPNVIKLLLPKSSSGQAVSKKTISVTISQDLKYTVNNKQIKIEDMQSTLLGYKKLASESTIVLAVDRISSHTKCGTGNGYRTKIKYKIGSGNGT